MRASRIGALVGLAAALAWIRWRPFAVAVEGSSSLEKVSFAVSNVLVPAVETIVGLVVSHGSRPALNSSRLVTPLLLQSLAASLGSFGFKPYLISQSSGMPSLSVSTTGVKNELSGLPVPPAYSVLTSASVRTRFQMARSSTLPFQ